MGEDEKKETDFSEDPFNRMMFGSRAMDTKIENNQSEQSSSLDYEELMINIDKLVDSAKNLKPLFQKFYPMIEQFFKKK